MRYVIAGAGPAGISGQTIDLAAHLVPWTPPVGQVVRNPSTVDDVDGAQEASCGLLAGPLVEGLEPGDKLGQNSLIQNNVCPKFRAPHKSAFFSAISCGNSVDFVYFLHVLPPKVFLSGTSQVYLAALKLATWNNV